MYRAYIALKKYAVVLDEVKSSSPHDELKYVRLLAEYLQNESKREGIVSDLDAKLGSLNVTNPLVILLIANIYYLAENYEMALKLLHNVDPSESLECGALTIQIYMKIDRLELARKELNKLVAADEDSLLTQLGHCLGLSSFGNKKTAPLAFCSYLFKIVFCCRARSYKTPFSRFKSRRRSTAPRRFSSTRRLFVSSTRASTTRRIACCKRLSTRTATTRTPWWTWLCSVSTWASRSTISNRNITQLKDSHKNHPFVRDFLQKVHNSSRLKKSSKLFLSHCFRKMNSIASPEAISPLFRNKLALKLHYLLLIYSL